MMNSRTHPKRAATLFLAAALGLATQGWAAAKDSFPEAKRTIEILKNDLAQAAPSVAPETPVLLRYAGREERPSAFWCS